MTGHLKKIIFSQQISNLFSEYNWIINDDSKNNFHSYFVGEIADYYLNIYNDEDKIYFQFTLDIEIPNSIVDKLLMLINIANQNSKEGYFVFDYKFYNIKYYLILPYYFKKNERFLYEFLKIKLNLIKSLFYNFVSGFHNLLYGDRIEIVSLELLFLNNEGYA